MIKKLSPVVAAGLFLTVLSCGLAVYKDRFEFLNAISLKAYDTFVKWVQEAPKSGRVVFVDIDEESLAAHRQWPWPRYIVSDLTRRILDGGASVLAFDIVFPEEDRTSPAMIERLFAEGFQTKVEVSGVPPGLEDFDLLFARTLSEAKNRTILGCFFFPIRGDEPAGEVPDSDPFYRGYFVFRATDGSHDGPFGFLPKADKMTISVSELNKAAGNNAFYNVLPDADNIIRKIPLLMVYGRERTYPSLALEAIRMDMGADKVIVEYDSVGGIECLKIRDTVIPTDEKGQILVNFRTPLKAEGEKGFRSFPSYSAADVLSGALDAGVFSNKVVFVGTSAAGLKDIRATPLTGEFAGVEVHATIVDNILSGDMLVRPWWGDAAETLAILLTGVLLTIFMYRGRAALSLAVAILVLAVAIEGSAFLFTRLHLAFTPVRLVASLLVILPSLTAIRFWQEERQKRQVRHMFGTMVSQEVLRYLENNPGSFSLSGHRTEATMFFSDIAGFTTISEATEPGKLSELINAYLSPMTKIIMDRKGYVDKYEGDLIMAEWGVPFAMEDHAVQACLAALEQQAMLDELRPAMKARFGHDLRVRMGINSGVVTAGNMGSDRKFQYTVLGDAVNLARRLEPANKDYSTRIIVGESTYAAAAHAVDARLLDKIVVAGRNTPVLIYELVARKGAMDERRKRASDLYEAAVRVHWERKWDESEKLLKEAMALDPADGAAAAMLLRTAEYRLDPPGEGWQGEYLRKSKE